MAANAMPLHTTVRPATTTAIEMRSWTGLAGVTFLSAGHVVTECGRVAPAARRDRGQLSIADPPDR